MDFEETLAGLQQYVGQDVLVETHARVRDMPAGALTRLEGRLHRAQELGRDQDEFFFHVGSSGSGFFVERHRFDGASTTQQSGKSGWGFALSIRQRGSTTTVSPPIS